MRIACCKWYFFALKVEIKGKGGKERREFDIKIFEYKSN